MVFDVERSELQTESGWGDERQRQAEKAEAVGHLVGGLVHDFNNLLNVIVGNLDRVGRLLPEDTIASRCVADATTATERAVALSRRLLAFVRQQPLLPQLVDIDSLMLDLKPLIEVAAPGCKVTLNLDCGWSILVDANQLENAVLNLTVNARDAMPGGGCLNIATRPSEVFIEGDKEGYGLRDCVILEVRDCGVGMTPELQVRALEPLYTTKAQSSGTGLGLNQVSALAKDCGGVLRIASEIGKGTTVTLHIPRAITNSQR